MSSIRPALIVGPGTHAELAAALRTRGIGPMLAPDAEQATRLLRNFRVDVVICLHLSARDIRKLAECASTLVIGGPETEAWTAGAAGFVNGDMEAGAAAEVAWQVARGERGVRATPHANYGSRI
jgi:hypothetical protein